MSKPSLHELISNEIYKEMLIIKRKDWTEQTCDELAEQIIKIVRDYHWRKSIKETIRKRISK